MQKLDKRDTYTPMNASQVRSNCDSLLNKEETLSVADLKTYSNIPEVNLSERDRDFQPLVYVLSVEGYPLMPCKSVKAKKLLKSGSAVVAKYKPFTIKLTYVCKNQTQDVSLGIDSGAKHIGFSAITSQKELISGTLELDDKTSSRLKERKMYRRLRRNKLWYRKPRFLNRKRKEGWLPPSIQRKYDTHLNLINRLKSILPITSITIEAANFDIQKIENPEIEGIGYQQGDMYGYQNVRSYLMFREKGKCQLCGKPFEKGNPSHVHHCKQRSERGSNSVKNLAILHKKCHTNLHKNNLKLKSPKSYKESTFMSIIRNKFSEDISYVKITYGYITFTDRVALGLSKEHYNDAFVIAGGGNQNRIKPITIIQKQINSRTLQIVKNGHVPSIRKQRYSYRPKDLIWVKGKVYSVRGVQNKGDYVALMGSKKVVNIKLIEKSYHFGSFVYIT